MDVGILQKLSEYDYLRASLSYDEDELSYVLTANLPFHLKEGDVCGDGVYVGVNITKEDIDYNEDQSPETHVLLMFKELEHRLLQFEKGKLILEYVYLEGKSE